MASIRIWEFTRCDSRTYGQAKLTAISRQFGDEKNLASHAPGGAYNAIGLFSTDLPRRSEAPQFWPEVGHTEHQPRAGQQSGGAPATNARDASKNRCFPRTAVRDSFTLH